MTELFLLLWIILPLIFFSASHSKLAPYIFPIFPPLAIAFGYYLSECWQGRISTKAIRINNLLVVALFSALILIYYFVPLPLDPDDKLDFATGITFPMLIPIIIGLAGLAYVTLSKRAAPVLITALLTFAVIFDLSANWVAGTLDRASVKPLIPILTARMKPGDWVASYGSYFQDLPIYLGSNVIVGNYLGELQFGYTHYPETHSWMLDDKAFWQYCAQSRHAGYIFMKKITYETSHIPANCRLRIVKEYGKNVLLEKESQ